MNVIIVVYKEHYLHPIKYYNFIPCHGRTKTMSNNIRHKKHVFLNDIKIVQLKVVDLINVRILVDATFVDATLSLLCSVFDWIKIKNNSFIRFLSNRFCRMTIFHVHGLLNLLKNGRLPPSCLPVPRGTRSTMLHTSEQPTPWPRRCSPVARGRRQQERLQKGVFPLPQPKTAERKAMAPGLQPRRLDDQRHHRQRRSHP